MKREARGKHLCLICGKPTARLICVPCAGRLRREALLEEIADERQGKKPFHLTHE